MNKLHSAAAHGCCMVSLEFDNIPLSWEAENIYYIFFLNCTDDCPMLENFRKMLMLRGSCTNKMVKFGKITVFEFFILLNRVHFKLKFAFYLIQIRHSVLMIWLIKANYISRNLLQNLLLCIQIHVTYFLCILLFLFLKFLKNWITDNIFNLCLLF